ncbi:cobalamin B12-binding domain-containing protein [Nocardioides lentus]|uniref:Cobalamin B12-binding domain-containing protein n=1 Tax=Nocardioides lentus TaxID=338077 RepID=A0ABN2P9G6_9ACTN
MDPQLWQALSGGDRHQSLTAVKRLRAAGLTADEIIQGHILPAQREVGHLWLTGAMSVTQEHATTAVSEGLVRWLGSFSDPPEQDRPLVVVACMEQEWHSLPALVVAEHLVAADHRVSYLGPSPDPGDMLRQVLRLKPRAVLFSASLTSALARQKRMLNQMHSLGLPIIVGGQGFGDDPRRALALGATAWAKDPAGAVRLLRELPLRGDRSPVDDPTPSDDDAYWIEEHRAELVAHVVTGMHRVAVFPDALWERSRDWHAELTGLTDHLVGCLSASLVTGDETILLEAHAWLARVLLARGVDGTLLVEAWSLLADTLRGHALARGAVAAAAGYADEAISAASESDGGTPGALWTL